MKRFNIFTGVEPKRSDEVKALRALAGYKTHGGYTWAGVTAEGETLCVKCVRANYRMHLLATKYPGKGWGKLDAIAGITYSGESDSECICASCNKVLWEGVDGE